MATRNPLIYSGGNLIEMTSAQIDAVVDNIVYQYFLEEEFEINTLKSFLWIFFNEKKIGEVNWN